MVDGLEDPATDASELTALRRFTSANNGRLAFTSRRTKPSSKLTKYRWPADRAAATGAVAGGRTRVLSGRKVVYYAEVGRAVLNPLHDLCRAIPTL